MEAADPGDRRRSVASGFGSFFLRFGLFFFGGGEVKNHRRC